MKEAGGAAVSFTVLFLERVIYKSALKVQTPAESVQVLKSTAQDGSN